MKRPQQTKKQESITGKKKTKTTTIYSFHAMNRLYHSRLLIVHKIVFLFVLVSKDNNCSSAQENDG
jgi:hypothetical protein